MRNTVSSFVLLVLLPLCILGQNSPSDEQTNKTSWEFDIAPYIWFSSLKGDISFRDQSLPVNANFKDILNRLKFGAMIHAEAHREKWTIISDLLYINMREEGSIEGVEQQVAVEINQTVWELGAGYKIVNIEDFLSVDGLFGVRYFGLGPQIEVNQQNVLDNNLDFLDPYFGVRMSTVNEKWTNSVRFDVGGLGIGSEISWKLNFLIGYHFNELLSLQMGYQGYNVHYKGDNSLDYNVYTGGFLTGLNFHF
jgi:hypothetical protein